MESHRSALVSSVPFPGLALQRLVWALAAWAGTAACGPASPPASHVDRPRATKRVRAATKRFRSPTTTAERERGLELLFWTPSTEKKSQGVAGVCPFNGCSRVARLCCGQTLIHHPCHSPNRQIADGIQAIVRVRHGSLTRRKRRNNCRRVFPELANIPPQRSSFSSEERGF
jgi:hypothetical protein